MSASVCLLIINRQIEVTDVTILITEARNTKQNIDKWNLLAEVLQDP